VSRQSLAFSAFSSFFAVDPFFRGNIRFIELRVLPQAIHRFSIIVRYSCIYSIVLCPLQVLKGGIASPIHLLRLQSPKVLQTSPSSLKSHRVIHRFILCAVAPLQVLKGGIATDPCFILGPTVSSSSALHRIQSSSSHPPRIILRFNFLFVSLPVKSSKGG
jgi:hypothetical protein